ncbi:hypothetical protein [uncultured Methanocorpusculum sp.]|nr:hypothetical protein [uncultured Methanocorpusculum sp.]
MAAQTIFDSLNETATNIQVVDSDTGLIILMLFFGGIILVGIILVTLGRRP